MALAAGSFSARVRIERRPETADDGAGNTLDDWVEVATRWAGWWPEFGREAVAAGRLESTRAGTVTLRRDATTETITAADRLVFVTGPEIGSIADVRSVIPLADAIEATVEIGVAT